MYLFFSRKNQEEIERKALNLDLREEAFRVREKGFQDWKEYEHDWHLKKELYQTDLVRLEERINHRKEELKNLANTAVEEIRLLKAQHENIVQHLDAIITSQQDEIKVLIAKLPEVNLKDFHVKVECPTSK